MKTIIAIWMIMMLSISAMAQRELTVQEYIDKFKHISIEEMERSGIPASITLAQGIIESRFGNSPLAVDGNNHFGIKCHTEWNGKKMYHDDDAQGECFRVYKNASESFKDHSAFLQTRSRYSFLFNYDATDYENWAHGLKKAGYATNPQYATILINLIEKEQLYLYDRPNRDLILAGKHEDRGQVLTTEIATNKEYKVSPSKTNHSQTNIITSAAMEVFAFNRIRTVKVGPKDDVKSIAQKHLVPQNRLMKYNDLNPGESLKTGQFVYLQPKRNKAVHREHIVQNGETMRDISQLHGVKLDKLYERNLMVLTEEPAKGQVIQLNQKSEKKPLLKSKEEIKEMNAVAATTKSAPKEKESLQMVIQNAELAMKKAEIEAQRKEAEQMEKIKSEAESVVSMANSKVAPKVVNETVKTEQQKGATFIQHEVVKGDTLYNLSKRYNVTIDDLKAWNSITADGINLGQILQVKK
jgi:LysM repeat protein